MSDGERGKTKVNQSFYTAAVGAAQQQSHLNVRANNIANVNTYGYKAQTASFASLMYGTVAGIGGEALPRGSGARLSMTGVDLRDGAVQNTGRAQDYAILGDGFFALYDPADGEISYTRDGSFTLSQSQSVNADGEQESVLMLSDGEGRFVLDNRGALLTVTDAEGEQPVGVFDFANTDGMVRVGENRFVPAAKNGGVRFGAGTVQRGALETSNVDLAQEITKVIEAQRSFSYALNMVETSDELETTANNLRT